MGGWTAPRITAELLDRIIAGEGVLDAAWRSPAACLRAIEGSDNRRGSVVSKNGDGDVSTAGEGVMASPAADRGNASGEADDEFGETRDVSDLSILTRFRNTCQRGRGDCQRTKP